MPTMRPSKYTPCPPNIARVVIGPRSENSSRRYSRKSSLIPRSTSSARSDNSPHAHRPQRPPSHPPRLVADPPLRVPVGVHCDPLQVDFADGVVAVVLALGVFG